MAGIFQAIFVGLAGLTCTTLFSELSPPGGTPPNHPHDDFHEAAELSGLFVLWTNHTSGATLESGEDALVPLDTSYTHSIWARWIAPVDGNFSIAAPSQATARVSIYVSSNEPPVSFETLTELQWNSPFAAKQGTTHYLRIATTVPTQISLRIGPTVTNTQQFLAHALTGTNISVNAQNWTAPRICYDWVAPAHGFVSYSLSSNLLSPSVYVGHYPLGYESQLPYTVYSNTVPLHFDDQLGQRMHSNSFVATAGALYQFSLAGSPTTNFIFNLSFTENTANLPANTFFGGNSFWILQTNTALSSPHALQAGPLDPSGYSWIEYLFGEPGTLDFSSKMEGAGTLHILVRPWPLSEAVTMPYSDPHDWTRRQVYIPASNTVVRFTLSPAQNSILQPTAWLDDFDFLPDKPVQPAIKSLSRSENALNFSFEVERNREAVVETSLNLALWSPHAVLYSPIPTNHLLSLPIITNEHNRFFRIRVVGTNQP